MSRLKDKTALITGATSGIGKAIAIHFADLGCHLILTGRREERLNELSRELAKKYDITVDTACFDIRDLNKCQEFAARFQGSEIDILVNNAGLAKGVDSVQSGSFEDWNTMIDTNVKGLLAMTRLFLPDMIARNSGHVINIGSTAGHEAYPGGVTYCATKHAVRAITESTKKDVHGTNIRVSMVSPGLVETEFSNVRFSGDDERADSVYNGMEPLTAIDIAEIVVFIATRPNHVNILDSIVMPVAQSSAQMVHRNEN
jgi:NADP-dependent 3-hydroxy acid dehydrogenase YdfG